MVDTGERLRNLTVKMMSPNTNQTWSGFIIGSTTTRTNRVATIIMSCTHALSSRDETVLVAFHRQNNLHIATNVLFMQPCDILVVIVYDYHHTYDYLRFPNVYPQPVPMPLWTGRRVHCVGYANGYNWIYHHGYIASELIINDDPSYDNNMTMFGLRGGISKGCSGSAVVDDSLDVLGILHKGHGNTLNLLGANPVPLRNISQTEQQYEDFLNANTTTLHDARFIVHNNVFIPLSSLTFAVSVFYIDAKIREKVPNHSGLPLNQVVVNYISQNY
ncbi:hypothetical protein POM88_027184 [Heracleum sosnowskyi]|uniref:Peptidase S1 domain-containing protein n=1 Tax=Heracleum sosnowskyi TaxID=360622 RepID=A0AAD8IAH6_9APIA|nr:hypothetical protein POM88_027184 [Heracleum sosnowskyi]